MPRAHPRSRGEHLPAGSYKVSYPGSSPLARGTPCAGIRSAMRGGLIPARAGNTWALARLPAVPWAHPRSRGEHVALGFALVVAKGSSPLARGTLLSGLGFCKVFGLIPARAGNTGGYSEVPPPGGAHPRSRGEHSHCWHCWAFPRGSSPLARGTHRVQVI